MTSELNNKIDLSDRTALITGAGIGIGEAIAMALAKAGADIALTYHSHDGASVAESIHALGRQAYSYKLDATDSGDVNRVVAEAAHALNGRIDILVNNAGGLVAKKELTEMDDAFWHHVIDLNLTSVFYCTRAALNHMGENGRIVTISSLAGRNGGRGSVAYATAKAGIHGFTRGLAKEVGNRGITVNAVAPGMILGTPFHSTFTSEEIQKSTIAASPLQRAGEPVDCAGAVLYLASPLASYVTGAIVDVNGGVYFS